MLAGQMETIRRRINELPNTGAQRQAYTAESADLPNGFFKKIPYILADSRDDVTAFLGFRHATGIKQWGAAEKAEYIAHLIEKKKMSYVEVMRTIGSKTDPVRRNYLAYRILFQLEDLEDGEKVSLKHVEEKFSVLFLALRERGVQRFLEINIQAGRATDEIEQSLGRVHLHKNGPAGHAAQRLSPSIRAPSVGPFVGEISVTSHAGYAVKTVCSFTIETREL